MNSAILRGTVLLGLAALVGGGALAGDWPQWRGPNRDAKADFEVPKGWPKELTRKWKVTVGDGVATPALVGDYLYVFTRQGDKEVIRCLKTEGGKEVWAKEHKAAAIGGPDRGFPGPRSSPAVADGKVVVLGVHGSLACYDAKSGEELWRKDDYKGSVPMFHTSSSPIIVGKLCVAQLGSKGKGAIAAYDLTSGKEKWKWTGDGTAYASPSLMTLGDKKVIIAETAGNIVGIGADDGKSLWKMTYSTKYNASSPIVDGDKVIYAGTGKGTKALELKMDGDSLKATDLWSNGDYSVIYNTPVIKDGLLYGLTDGNLLYCLSMKDGKKKWDKSLGGGGKGRSGYGSIVDVRDALMALTPAGELIFFRATDKEFEQYAKYSVGKGTYAYPIASGKRIFIKDSDSVAMYLIGEE